MSKNKFRLLISISLLLVFLTGFVDYFWPDPVAEQITEYINEIEEFDEEQLMLVGFLFFVSLLAAIISFVGMLLFKSWSRHLYVIGFAVALLAYPFIGHSVYGGLSQLLYDLSMILSGAIIVLIYYSPVAKYFEKQI